MKVTKFGQSCLVVERDGKRLLIDPGSFFAQAHRLDDVGPVDAVLYTHQHFDHFDAEIWKQIKDASIPAYGNASVAEVADGINLIASGEKFEAAGFAIETLDIEHFTAPQMPDPPQNTAFILDGILVHTGDGKEMVDLAVAHAALPIGGPTGEEFARFQIDFARRIGARKVVPVHYDYFKFDPREWARMAEGIETVVLEDGGSAEL